jgi:hypothetical protein
MLFVAHLRSPERYSGVINHERRKGSRGDVNVPCAKVEVEENMELERKRRKLSERPRQEFVP